MKKKLYLRVFVPIVAINAICPVTLGEPVGSSFSYQGQLKKDGLPVTNADSGCDFAFRLFDDPSVDNQVGPELQRTLPVINGLFSVNDLDFGASTFSGDERWLEVEVRCPDDPGPSILFPRNTIGHTPYAIHSQGVRGLVVIAPGPADCCCCDEPIPTQDCCAVDCSDNDLGSRFNAAVTDLSLAGGTIIIPPGEYCTRTELVIPDPADGGPEEISIIANGAVIRTHPNESISGIRITGRGSFRTIHGLTIDHRGNPSALFGFNLERTSQTTLYNPAVWAGPLDTDGPDNLDGYAAIRLGREVAAQSGATHFCTIIHPMIWHGQPPGRKGTGILIEDNSNSINIIGGSIQNVQKGVVLKAKQSNNLPNAITVYGVAFDNFDIGVGVEGLAGQPPGRRSNVLGLRIVNNRFENEAGGFQSGGTVLSITHAEQRPIPGFTEFSRSPYLAGNMVAWRDNLGGRYLHNPGAMHVNSYDRGPSIGLDHITPGLVTIADVKAIKLAPTDTPGGCGADQKGRIFYSKRMEELCFCGASGWMQVDGGGPCSACGNGAIEAGEDCDDGGESETCDADCTTAVCGDGLLNLSAGEWCDDSYVDACGWCNSDCTGRGAGSNCGDGDLCMETEKCDDGNRGNSDSCPDGKDGSCLPAFCGDGFVWSTDGGMEQCDDGNQSPGDGCSPTCQLEP